LSNEKQGAGIRTRVLLMASLVLVIAGTTAASLLIIRGHLHRQVQETFQADLRHSVETFQDLENGRLAALDRENALMSALPSLKALMTTGDARTVEDDAGEFWKTSGNDLFALADTDLHVMAVEAKDLLPANSPTNRRTLLKRDLQTAITAPATHYLLSDGRLFEYAVHPLYFGSQSDGTLLGYVISGFAIDSTFLREVGRGAGAEAAFVANNALTVSTLSQQRQQIISPQIRNLEQGATAIVVADRERYLVANKDVAGGTGMTLMLVVMKSFDQADRAEHEMNRLILFISLFALAAGSLLVMWLASKLTRPLELLATGVRAFGEGDLQHTLPQDGTQEVRFLSRVFSEMRDEIQKTNRALLESERLATIGRMASSVSHDLRHYLASVYANAEFLASPTLPQSERAELFDEIRHAVNGTTDMLDSLLIFSRTGNALQRVQTTMASVVERAVTLVRAHPDAERIAIQLDKGAFETSASIDTKQMERAVYNLLLNACQSARECDDRREVFVSFDANPANVSVIIQDSGPGVAEGIRESLFDPFVSLGKQKGTGLGLTLAWSVAREHGGEVKLVSSKPGETIFQLTVARHLSDQFDKNNPTRTKVLTS
jgi:signal transduction histidine kinase